MPDKSSDLSEGVNGCLDKGDLVDVVYTNFFRALSARSLGKKKGHFIYSVKCISNLLAYRKEKIRIKVFI